MELFRLRFSRERAKTKFNRTCELSRWKRKSFSSSHKVHECRNAFRLSDVMSSQGWVGILLFGIDDVARNIFIVKANPGETRNNLFMHTYQNMLEASWNFHRTKVPSNSSSPEAHKPWKVPNVNKLNMCRTSIERKISRSCCRKLWVLGDEVFMVAYHVEHTRLRRDVLANIDEIINLFNNFREKFSEKDENLKFSYQSFMKA